MTDVVSVRPVLAVLVPGVAVVPILASGRRPNLREAWTFLAALCLFGVVAASVGGVLDGVRYVTPLASFAPGAQLALRIDPFGAMFASLASTLWIVTSVYSVGYMRALSEADQTRYFASFAASIAATMGVAFAANLLTLFVFYELLTVATYPLVAHDETSEARAAGRSYLLYTLGGGVVLLAGLLVVYALAGTVAFTPGGVATLAGTDPLLARVGFGLLVVGFGVKTALVPLHGWLPGAMVAPTPVSGLLHAVAVVKSGAFGLGRVVLYVYGPEQVAALGVGLALSVAAGVTMLVAGVLALRATKLKPALAYSTVSQLSYIALGFGLDVRLAVFGAMLHVVAHAFMKITLFFAAGVVYVETGVKRLAAMRGIARRLPVTMTAFAVTAAGLAGFPLVAGFVSKWYLVVGSLAADRFLFGLVFLLAGLLKLLLFWPIVTTAFFPERSRTVGGAAAPTGDAPVADGGESFERRSPPTESRAALLGPVVVVAVGSVVLGVVPELSPHWALARAVVTEVFG